MRARAMKPLWSSSSWRRRSVWLLWLALVLPIAQVAASWHSLSHLESETSSNADSQGALPLGHCGLCLTAAAIGGGAPPTDLPAMPPLPVASDEVPQAAFVGVRLAFYEPAYLSRAPPLAPH